MSAGTFHWRGKRRLNAPGLHQVMRNPTFTVWVDENAYTQIAAYARNRGISIRAAADEILQARTA